MTLNTFHQAGTAHLGVTNGVPRMKEIIGASKHLSTPVLTLPMQRALPDTKHAAEALARSLPHTVLRHVVLNSTLVYEPDVTATHVDEDRELVAEHLPFLEYAAPRCCRWVIRMRLNKARAASRSLEPRGIATLVYEELGGGAVCVTSRTACAEWVLRVYLVDVANVVDAALKRSLHTGGGRTARRVSAQRSSLTRKRRRYADLSELGVTSGDAVLPVPLHRIDPHVGRTEHSSRDVIEWMLVRNTQTDLLGRLRVCGLPGITEATTRATDITVIDPDTGEARTEETHVVDALGTNLQQAALLPGVDSARVISNDVCAVYRTLGLTAAAQTLYQELRCCLSASGSRVDERLIKLVTDVMTHNGFVMPISRHGLNRLTEHGVLAKITFEETLEMLFEAAALGYYDPLRGVSETTMVGQRAHLGTNLSRVAREDANGDRIDCAERVTAASAVPAQVLTSVVTETGLDGHSTDSDGDDDEDMSWACAAEPVSGRGRCRRRRTAAPLLAQLEDELFAAPAAARGAGQRGRGRGAVPPVQPAAAEHAAGRDELHRRSVPAVVAVTRIRALTSFCISPKNDVIRAGVEVPSFHVTALRNESKRAPGAALLGDRVVGAELRHALRAGFLRRAAGGAADHGERQVLGSGT